MLKKIAKNIQKVTNTVNFEDVGMDVTHSSFACEKKPYFIKMYLSRNS